MDILLKKHPHEYFVGKEKRIARDDFKVCLLNTKSFYHDLMIKVDLVYNL